MFYGIDLLAFVIVAVASITATVVVVGFYALGIRLLALAEPLPEDLDPDTPAHEIRTETGTIVVVIPLTDRQRRWALFGSRLCFIMTGIAVLLGIFLIIPVLHDLVLPS